MDIQQLLPDLPGILGKSLSKHYKKIKENFLEGRYEPSELNGAKFSEVIFRILEWHVSPNGSYTPPLAYRVMVAMLIGMFIFAFLWLVPKWQVPSTQRDLITKERLALVLSYVYSVKSGL